MTVWTHFHTAIGALQLNALRSLLTTLGIIIGVGAVLVMVAVGTGARQAVEARINSLGTNLLTASPGSSLFGGRQAGAGTAPALSERDLIALRERLSQVAEVLSGSLNSSAAVIYGHLNWSTSVNGVHETFPVVRDWLLTEGRFFTERELTAGARVAVLGSTVARELFNGQPALGERIRIKNVAFEVIGLMQSRGQSTSGRDQDDIVLVPITTARARIAGRDTNVPDQIGQILIKVRDGENLQAVADDASALLRERRRLRGGTQDDFNVRSLADYVRARAETQNTLSWLLGATAAISLLVGGIGIMNIMLVSVTERTREIGLRMALGARPGDILTQFLMEAVLLCAVGGCIGLAIGGAVIVAIAQFAGWPVQVNPAMVLLSLGAATSVGLFFGYFPARRAANLNPIEALRYE